jgi:hypothetical protein
VGWGFLLSRENWFSLKSVLPQWGLRRTAPPQYVLMFLHPRPDCKQFACKYGPEKPQRAGFTGCSTLEINRT